VRTISIVAALVTAALVCIEAQSLKYRDPSIPRTRDGRPNLSAPAPRLSGKPDLSGVWQAERTPVSEFVRVLGPGLPEIQPDLNDITKHVLNVLWDVPPAEWPLRPEAAALTAQRQKSGQDFPTAYCQPSAWLDGFGHPRSEAMRITERYRRRDFGHMDLELTFDDPKYYTRGFGFKTTLTLLPDTDVLEYVCTENQRRYRPPAQ
jgi:hypothetical protein